MLPSEIFKPLGIGRGECLPGAGTMPDRSTDNQRRALEILAGAPHGLTETTMFAQGFAADMLAGLVLAGLATVVTGTARAGGPTTKAKRFMITDAGRAGPCCR